MKDLIIQNYVNNLEKNDINSFALKNNIYLNQKEIDIIYETIKKEWKNIKNRKDEILNKLQNNITPINYQKGIKLLEKYDKTINLFYNNF